MTRLLSIGAVLSVMIVCSSACQRSEGPEVQNTPQTATTPAPQRDEDEWRIDESKVLLAGTFNRETKVLQISQGLPEPRTFENFDSAFLTLAQAGYQQAGLRRLRTILINEKDIDDEDLSAPTTTEQRFDSSDVLGTFQVTNNVVGFTLYDLNISGYSDPAKVNVVVENNKSQGGCEPISKSCIKCPNGRIYCVVKNLKRIGG